MLMLRSLNNVSPKYENFKRLIQMARNFRGTTALRQKAQQQEQPQSLNPNKQLIIEQLTERELLRIQGEEVVPFLQGLVTNDMSHLQTGQSSSSGASMYSMFLNKAGRIMYDTIIYRTQEPNTYLIECDKQISSELQRHLRLYRVRRKIAIDSAVEEYKPWIIFDPAASLNGNGRISSTCPAPEIFTSIDPRISSLGLRIITTPDRNWRELSQIFSKQGEELFTTSTTENNYRIHRYRFGVGEGVNDMPPGKCFPLEANGDFLHGVSFQKGCYIGQELTARVYHTGVIRKRLMPLRLTKPLSQSSTIVQTLAGANVGTVRGVSHDRALALLRVEQVLNSPELTIDGDSCYAEKPKWWPSELPKRVVARE